MALHLAGNDQPFPDQIDRHGNSGRLLCASRRTQADQIVADFFFMRGGPLVWRLICLRIFCCRIDESAPVKIILLDPMNDEVDICQGTQPHRSSFHEDCHHGLAECAVRRSLAHGAFRGKLRSGIWLAGFAVGATSRHCGWAFRCDGDWLGNRRMVGRWLDGLCAWRRTCFGRHAVDSHRSCAGRRRSARRHHGSCPCQLSGVAGLDGVIGDRVVRMVRQ